MKYIRTKCGKIVKHPHPNDEVFTFRYEIEKVADTIEELCDGFYLEIESDCYTNNVIGISKNIFFKFKPFVRNYLYWKQNDEATKVNGYGFIKTDKGLIYVAKLNDKGELELI